MKNHDNGDGDGDGMGIEWCMMSQLLLQQRLSEKPLQNTNSLHQPIIIEDYLVCLRMRDGCRTALRFRSSFLSIKVKFVSHQVIVAVVSSFATS